MLKQLIKKEILEHLMSLRFAITCVLCLMVILSSLFVRGRDYTQASEDYYESVAMKKTTFKIAIIKISVNAFLVTEPLWALTT